MKKDFTSSDINKKLLSALKELLIDMTLAQKNMRRAAKYDLYWESCIGVSVFILFLLVI